MPELPEVETARLDLLAWASGRRVVRAYGSRCPLFRDHGPALLARRLTGATLVSADRRGKVIVSRWRTDTGEVGLRIHLGMTGKLLRRSAGDPAPRHSRAFLELDDGSRIHFISPRILGHLTVGAPEALAEAWRGYGPDPLVDGLTGASLARGLGTTRRAVKVALLDSSVVAGVGNIQAAEALWLARLAPTRPGHSLDPAELNALARGIRRTLKDTLTAMRGREVVYLGDGAENHFRVYGQAGQPCRRCGTSIERTVLGGRATFACPSCQSSSPSPG